MIGILDPSVHSPLRTHIPLELLEMHSAVALTERKKAGKKTQNCLKFTFTSLKVFFSPGIKVGSDVRELFSCGGEGFCSSTTLISKYLFVPLILIEQIVCLLNDFEVEAQKSQKNNPRQKNKANPKIICVLVLLKET